MVRIGRSETYIQARVYLDEREETIQLLQDGLGQQYIVDIFCGEYRFCAKAILAENNIELGGYGSSVLVDLQFLAVGETIFQPRHLPVLLMLRQPLNDFRQYVAEQLEACTLPQNFEALKGILIPDSTQALVKPTTLSEEIDMVRIYEFTVAREQADGAVSLLELDGKTVVTVPVSATTKNPTDAVKLKAMKLIAREHADVPEGEIEIAVRPFDR